MHAVLILASLLAAAGQVMFKTGAQGRSELLEFFNAWVFLGLGAYGLSTMLWIWSLSKMPLRLVYPYTALTFVCVYLAAFLVFDERPSLRGVAGVGLVLGGLFMITTDR